MIGIMGGDIKLSALQEYIRESSEKGSWAFILDGKGVVVAHPEPQYLEELFNYQKMTRTVTLKDAQGQARKDANGNIRTEEQPFAISGRYRAAITDMMAGNPGSAKFRENGGILYISYRPVTIDGVSDPWYVISVKEAAVVMATRNTVILVILIAGGMIGLIALGIIFFVARSISRPIKGVYSVLQKIGEGDLTGKITVRSQDEIGEMMRLLDKTREGMGSLIMTIQDKAVSLEKVGAELSLMMNESAAAVHELDTHIHGMQEKFLTQAASISESDTTLNRIIQKIESLNDHIAEQSTSVSRSSASIAEMTGNIASVTQTLVQNDQNVSDLAAAAEKGYASLRQVSEDIQEVSKESERLLEINQVIQNIASQTNLLSMNAAIEAAHAGEVGKGFAVVADEIRKLAESSAKQAKTVSEVLTKIKKALDGINSSTEAALNHFGDIDSGVRIVSEQETLIRNAMEAQDTGSREILETMGSSISITENVQHSSEEMISDSKDVINEGRNLNVITNDLTGAMHEIAQGINYMNTTVARVKEISRENKESIGVLIDEIAKFKI
jgi:methyl-accepting chemotaxis protein